MRATGRHAMTGRHEMWDGEDVFISVPQSGGENVMVPVIRGVVRSVDDPSLILLQRRGNPSESVHGLFELPGGRWRAGESPVDALSREVLEETGVIVTDVRGIDLDSLDVHRTIASVKPLVVVAGVDQAFPAIHVVLTADGEGVPRDTPGETSDVRWWTIESVRNEMGKNRGGFVPSTYAALCAYVDWLASAEPS
jgi:ADP-ribose pyrophosphatase YjhB (NUDIX family)